MSKRLLDNHPLMIKYRLLEAFLELNKIIIIRGDNGLKIYDQTSEIEVDIVNSENSNKKAQTIPYRFELKLIIQ